MDKSVYKKIILFFIVTRIYLTVIGFAAVESISPYYEPELAWQATQSHPLVNLYARWDSGWYLSIVDLGYVADSSKYPGYVVDEGIDLEANKAFFPLYPLLVKVLGNPLNDNLLAGVILSNLFYLIALLFLYKLAALDYSEKTALTAVLFALVYPVNFILSGFFTESLFLALTISAFYYARKNRWPLAGMLGFLSAITRPLGVLIVIPLMWEYAHSKKTRRKSGLYLLLIPFGPLIFFTYLYTLTGDPLSFLNTQKMLFTTGFANPIIHSIEIFLIFMSSPDAWSRLSFVIFSALALSYMFKWKFRPSYIMYSLYTILMPVITKKIFSMPRFTLVVFPIYLFLAKASENKKWEKSLVGTSLFLMTLFMMLWVIGTTHII